MLESVAFWLSLFCFSIPLGRGGLLRFLYFVFRFGSRDLVLHYFFVHVFQVSRSQKTNFSLISGLVIKPLACIKSSRLSSNFYHSFSRNSFCRIAPKITVKYIFVVFSRPFFPLVSLGWLVVLVVVCLSEINTANVRRIPSGSLCWLLRKQLPIIKYTSQVDLDLSFFLVLFLTHTACLCHLWDVRPYTSSWMFFFSGQFTEVLFSSILRMVLSILQEWQPSCLSL